MLGSSDAVVFSTVGIVITVEGALIPVVGTGFPILTAVVVSAVYTV